MVVDQPRGPPVVVPAPDAPQPSRTSTPEPAPKPEPTPAVADGPAPETPAPAAPQVAKHPSLLAMLPDVNAPPSSGPREQNAASPNGFGGVLQNERPGETSGGSFAPSANPTKADTPLPVLPASTGAGQSLLNLVPQASGFNRNNVKKLPEGMPILVMRFMWPCGNICAESQGSQRKGFEGDLKREIQSALANSPVNKFSVELDAVLIPNIVSINDATAVQVAILPPNGVNIIDIMTELRRQILDSSSPLHHGSLKGLDAGTVGVDIIKRITNDSLVDNPKLDTTYIVAISIGAYLVLMAAFVVGYRHYKKRAREAEERNVHAMSVYYKGEKMLNDDSYVDGSVSLAVDDAPESPISPLDGAAELPLIVHKQSMSPPKMLPALPPCDDQPRDHDNQDGSYRMTPMSMESGAPTALRSTTVYKKDSIISAGSEMSEADSDTWDPKTRQNILEETLRGTLYAPKGRASTLTNGSQFSE